MEVNLNITILMVGNQQTMINTEEKYSYNRHCLKYIVCKNNQEWQLGEI